MGRKPNKSARERLEELEAARLKVQAELAEEAAGSHPDIQQLDEELDKVQKDYSKLYQTKYQGDKRLESYAKKIEAIKASMKLAEGKESDKGSLLYLKARIAQIKADRLATIARLVKNGDVVLPDSESIDSENESENESE